MFMRWPEIGVEEIERALEKLATAKRIQRYSSGDREFALIASWDKNQPVHNASQFRYPRPEQEVTAPKPLRQQQGSGRGEAVLRPSSHPIYPDTQTPVVPDNQTPKSSGPASGSVPYLAEFEEVFAAYPKRAGGDNKREGYLAFRARMQAGATAAEILEGVRRYAAYCRATDKIGTEFVKQLRTFLGKSRHYLEPWALPRGAGAPALRETTGAKVREEDALLSKFNVEQREAALAWAEEHPDELEVFETSAVNEVGIKRNEPGYEVVRRQFLTQKCAAAAGFPAFEEWRSTREVTAV